jgi:hypothetical protein
MHYHPHILHTVDLDHVPLVRLGISVRPGQLTGMFSIPPQSGTHALKDFTFIVLPLHLTLRIWSTIIRQSTACDPCVKIRIILLYLLALM